MSKYRRAAKIDANQPAIVEALRSIPGVTVAVGHDDILVGYAGNTYWYEVKTSVKSPLRKGQKDLVNNWKGHYRVVSSIVEILEDFGRR